MVDLVAPEDLFDKGVQKVAPLMGRLPRGRKSPFGDPRERRKIFRSRLQGENGSAVTSDEAIGFERFSGGPPSG